MKFCARFFIFGFIISAIVLSAYGVGINAIIALNVITLIFFLIDLKLDPKVDQSVYSVAQELGIEHRFQSGSELLGNVVEEVSRKNRAFSINIAEEKIHDKEKLSQTLERIVNLAYNLFKAESVELALYNRATNLYHSSIVIGTPMHTSSQAMLSDAAGGAEIENRPDVLIQTLSFAGTMLGTLRIGLKKGTMPRIVDQEIAKLVALQASLALINAQYTTELVRMKVSSQETLKAKTGFLANLSHEIRAPLGIMLNAVELVLDGLCGAVNKDQTETLQMVHKNGEHLLELINDVLDYAKVESGRLQTNKVDIVIGELLEDVCNVVRSQADAKLHKLNCKSTSEAFAISCDRRHARQMLINLLTNAIKYTPDGGKIEVWAERGTQGKVKIHVKDTGVGIEDSEREKVFAPFERLDNSYSLNQVGTGLGMPLTRKLAEVNGGVVDFTSKPGEGSDFWLVFPTIDASTVINEPKVDEIKPVAGKGEVVLLVEQDEGERAVAQKYLSHHGFTVHAASGKQDALQIINNKKLDLAIVDNRVADQSEEDVIKAIRSNSQSAGLPIILVSSKGFVFDIERYLKSGIDRCLIKPLKLAELSNICRQLLDGTFSGEMLDESDKTLIEATNSSTQEAKVAKITTLIKLEDIYKTFS